MSKVFLLLHFIFLTFMVDVRAQILLGSRESNNFKTIIALVIGFLTGMFVIAFLLLFYAKFCHRRANDRHSNVRVRVREGMLQLSSSASGVDRAVIDSLPTFRFSSIKGSRHGLECSICLSRFEDAEMLRLLPKCQHAFHIACIDQWLEKQSTCPLCRRKICPEDVSELPHANSPRSESSQSGEIRDESDFELYLQREEIGLGSSSFSFMSRYQRGTAGGEFPAQRSDVDPDQFNRRFHRFNHRVVGYNDAVFKNRWSDVSSSDLMSLNSEFLTDASSSRYMSESCMEIEEIQEENDQTMRNIISQTDGHSFFNFPGLPTTSDSPNNLESGSNFPHSIGKRSMSEIVIHPRFPEFEDHTDSFPVENSGSERIRSLWMPIAMKTVQWFSDRQSRSPNPQDQSADHYE